MSQRKKNNNESYILDPKKIKTTYVSHESSEYLKERRERRKRKHKEFFSLILNIIQTISISVTAYRLSFGYYLIDTVISKTQYLYLFFTIIFFICWFLSRFQLSTSLTFFPKINNNLLLTSGFYYYFQNPIYYFGSLSLFFYILFLNQLKFLFVFFIIIPLQIFRSLKEKKLLRKRFGEAYDEYVSRTWF